MKILYYILIFFILFGIILYVDIVLFNLKLEEYIFKISNRVKVYDWYIVLVLEYYYKFFKIYINSYGGKYFYFIFYLLV